ncbi:MAG: GAF domain-containing protein [Anaerolineae bacterium]|nr:GAF domain-containing protein [Anaerolineae bacterium]
MKIIRRLLSPLNILAWPMWIKLSVGFILAILIPALLVGFVVQSGFTQITVSTLQDYVEEQGKHQNEAIQDDFSAARNLLDEITNEPEGRAQLVQVAQLDAMIGADVRHVANRLRSLLQTWDTFTEMRLLNNEGRVIAESTEAVALAPWRLDTDSVTFINAQTELLQNRTNSISILRQDDRIRIEMTEAIIDPDGQAVGFLVGTFNQEILIERLDLPGEVFPIYSYLATREPDLIILASPEHRAKAEAAALDSPAITRVFNDRVSGAGRYALSDQKEVLGYYAPISNPASPQQPLFALVTEVEATAPLLQASDYFSGARVFVIGIGLLLMLTILVLLFNQLITPPLVSLRRAIQSVAQGQFNEPVPAAGRGDEIGELGAAFIDMRFQVRGLLDDLEARIAARARDISATQEISRFAATQRNLQSLMDQVVSLIVERFPDIYHAQIFLIDPERIYAVLRASTGEVGQQLLKRGHRLAVGSVSVIGQTTEQGQPVITRDTAASSVHRRNEFLPDTRAEVAIPLKIGETIIGALDVQSKFRNAFTEDEIIILQTMADQIAVAIENARLYQESVRRLEEIERSNRRATMQTWQEYIYGQRRRQLSSEAGTATGNDLSELRRRALTLGRVVIGEVTRNNTVPVAVPIQLRGQTLGAVEWELPAEDLNANKLQLAQELANRLAVSLENARLFEESQRATERERIVNSIAAKLTPQTEISEILQTAVREVGQALRAPQVSIRLHRNATSLNGGENGSSNGNGSGSNGSTQHADHAQEV